MSVVYIAMLKLYAIVHLQFLRKSSGITLLRSLLLVRICMEQNCPILCGTTLFQITAIALSGPRPPTLCSQERQPETAETIHGL